MINVTASAEDYLSKYFENQSWILRLAPVYKKDFLLNIMRRTKILNFNYKIGSGNCKLSLCNIKNITTTVENILLNKVPYGVYIISDPLNYSYNDLLKWRKDLKYTDPFGDFDFLFSAAYYGEKILEYPVHYKARIYGKTQISRFRDGFKLMVYFMS